MYSEKEKEDISMAEETKKKAEENKASITLNIYQKLGKAKLELRDMMGRKSGYNEQAEFAYFQLEDFMPQIDALGEKYGFVTRFTMHPTYQLEDIAKLSLNPNAAMDLIRKRYTAEVSVIDTEEGHESIDFAFDGEMPYMPNPMQAMGAMATYMRRYAYMIAFDIAEPDSIDVAQNQRIPEEAVRTAGSDAAKAAAVTKAKRAEEREARIQLVPPENVETAERLNQLCRGNGKYAAWLKAETNAYKQEHGTDDLFLFEFPIEVLKSYEEMAKAVK